MTFGTADRRKADVAEGVAIAVGHLATQRGNRLGIVTFGGPPTGGCRRRRVATGCSRAARSPSARRRPCRGAAPARRGRPADALRFVDRGRAARRARRPRLRLPRAARLAADRWRPSPTRHQVLAVEIDDPREAELPDVGELTLIDAETGREVRVDTSSRALRERFRTAADGRAAVARRASCAGSASTTSSCPPRATGCATLAGQLRDPRGIRHDLRRPEPPDRAARSSRSRSRLPPHPAAARPLRRAVHERRPARPTSSRGRRPGGGTSRRRSTSSRWPPSSSPWPGRRWRVAVPREEATIILTMDVSGSMMATDVAPTRLAAAQTGRLDFVDQLPADVQGRARRRSRRAPRVARRTDDRSGGDPRGTRRPAGRRRDRAR